MKQTIVPDLPLAVVPDVPQTEHDRNIYYWKVSVSRGDDDKVKEYRKLIEQNRKMNRNTSATINEDVAQQDLATDKPTPLNDVLPEATAAE